MQPERPPLKVVQPDALRRHGFLEPGSERGLWELAQLAATVCEAPAVLALRDGSGLWLCQGAGFAPGQLAALEPWLARELRPRPEPGFLDGSGFCLLAGQGLRDPGRPPMGCLWVVAPEWRSLTEAQRAGVRQIAAQAAARVIQARDRGERRGADRNCVGSSFVPGLVHELRNFSFGISGSLDAFQARVAGQDLCKYGTVMRGSLDRLNAFIEELREYGDPQGRSWSELALEPLLGEAMAHLQEPARKARVDLRLLTPGQPLPRLRADAASLRAAFIRLLELALQQEPAGGRVEIQVAARREGPDWLLAGQVDSAGLVLPDLDLGRLFEPFYYRASGLGRLALPVARRILEAHGGSLAAAPGPEGGLRLSFLLPGL